MCRYTTISLSATDCDRIRVGEAAHVYTKYSYWLCRDARGNRPCENLSPREEQIGSDLGSRQGPCPTCDKLNNAEYEYKQALARATEEYNAKVNSAWHRREEEKGNADYVTESFPYRHRRHYSQRSRSSTRRGSIIEFDRGSYV